MTTNNTDQQPKAVPDAGKDSGEVDAIARIDSLMRGCDNNIALIHCADAREIWDALKAAKSTLQSRAESQGAPSTSAEEPVAYYPSEDEMKPWGDAYLASLKPGQMPDGRESLLFFMRKAVDWARTTPPAPAASAQGDEV